MTFDDYQKMFLDRVDKSIKGEVNLIPNPYSRLGRIFNIVRGRFVLIGSTSGAGKTSLTDDLFVLKSYDYTKHDPKFHFETHYFSMERSRAYKYAKWTSWFMYRYGNIRISADKLLGIDGTGPIDTKTYNTMLKFKPYLEDLLESVHIYDGRTDYDTLRTRILKTAFKLGTLYKSDDLGVKINDKDDYSYFFDSSKTIKTKLGSEEYVEITHKKETFKMFRNMNKYIYDNDKTIVQFIIDGIGLIKRNGGNTKSAIDDVIDLLADARDIFEFNVIVISQFNRGISETLRRVHSGENLQPQEADFKDSANHYQAADLVLAPFDPYKFQAMNDDEKYRGYHIPSLISPQGVNRLRTLHVLKNTFGVSDIAIGLLFVGESNWFESLPKADDEAALLDLYGKIKLNKL